MHHCHNDILDTYTFSRNFVLLCNWPLHTVHYDVNDFAWFYCSVNMKVTRGDLVTWTKYCLVNALIASWLQLSF